MQNGLNIRSGNWCQPSDKCTEMVGLMSQAKLPTLLQMMVTGFAGPAEEIIPQPQTLHNPLLMSHLLLSNYPKQVMCPNLELISEETIQGHGYRKAQANWYH